VAFFLLDSGEIWRDGQELKAGVGANIASEGPGSKIVFKLFPTLQGRDKFRPFRPSENH
jgi:hypothetical protein